MKSRPILGWLIILTLLINTGLNLFFLYNLSRVYTINDDFRPDILSHLVRDEIEADNIKIPPIEIFKFFSVNPHAKDYVVIVDQTIAIFINLKVLNSLSDNELRALLAHEIGHYVLGHLSDRPKMFSGFEEGDLAQEIKADLFAAKYEGNESISSAINKLVWDENEKKVRLEALGVGP